MSTLKEQIAIMQHFENGGEIEYYSPNNEEWVISDDPIWNWNSIEYRIKEKKETVTIEKWLMVSWGGHLYIREASIEYIEANFDKPNQVKLLETYEVEL